MESLDPYTRYGFKRAKMAQKNRKQVKNFIFLSAGCFLVRAEGFSCSLYVLGITGMHLDNITGFERK
jgi:hypothetical protein